MEGFADILVPFASAIVGGLFAAGAAYGAISAELRSLRRDITRLERIVLTEHHS